MYISTAISTDNIGQIDAFDVSDFKTLKNSPLLTNDYDTPVTENTVTVVLVGANASATTPSAANRRLQLIMIKELDRR